MERYLLIAGYFVTFVAFMLAAVFLLRAARHFIQMLAHFRSGRHELTANLVPFMVPFMSQLFTEQGNVHRHGFVVNFGWFICCFSFIAAMFALLGIRGQS